MFTVFATTAAKACDPGSASLVGAGARSLVAAMQPARKNKNTATLFIQ